MQSQAPSGSDPAPHRSDWPSIPNQATQPPRREPSEPAHATPAAPVADGRPSAALPPTSLDPDETSVGFAPPCPADPDQADNTELHQTFRHSFWRIRREAVHRALSRLELSAETLNRFATCGSSAWVLSDPADPDRFKLATNRCRNRWCQACGREKRAIVVGNLRESLRDRELRLLTLTLAARADPLPTQLQDLYRSFRVFRQRKAIASRMTGGVYFLELTFNVRTERWHPHLHVIFEGSFLPHPVIKNAWLDVTDDSYIVDVRALHGSDGAARYVAKYATKAIGADVWRDRGRLETAMRALAGRRTFQTFGTWTDLDLSKSPADDTPWIPLYPLADLIRRYRAGDANAGRILSKLTANDPSGPLDLPGSVGDTS